MAELYNIVRGEGTYGSKALAIAALDAFTRHQNGQVVILTYKAEDDSIRSLKAIGRSATTYDIVDDGPGIEWEVIS